MTVGLMAFMTNCHSAQPGFPSRTLADEALAEAGSLKRYPEASEACSCAKRRVLATGGFGL